MQPHVILQLLVLLSLANGAPVVAKKLLGRWLVQPVDCGLKLADGRPLFGPSKTIRGIVVAIIATAAGAPLIGVSPTIGAIAAVAAMAGDLLSSFLKRRLGLRSSAQAIGLDQVPEALLPALACRAALTPSLADIAIVVALFFVGELVVSRLLYLARLRDEPY
jgi:CDP-2,3-bis-(O-geranylgeranyl)-sn-glycerol synthase